MQLITCAIAQISHISWTAEWPVLCSSKPVYTDAMNMRMSDQSMQSCKCLRESFFFFFHAFTSSSFLKIIAPCWHTFMHFLHPIQTSGNFTYTCLWIPKILIFPNTCLGQVLKHSQQAWQRWESTLINLVWNCFIVHIDFVRYKGSEVLPEHIWTNEVRVWTNRGICF